MNKLKGMMRIFLTWTFASRSVEGSECQSVAVAHDEVLATDTSTF